MTGAAKIKGDRAEREAVKLIAAALGYNVKRALGAGRAEDVGDVWGVPQTAIQIAAWKDVTRALRVKPVEAATQAANAGVPFAATFLRLHGGDWRVVLTPDQFFTLLRDALAEREVS